MAISLLIPPDMWVGDYPSDVRVKYGTMSERGRKFRPNIAILTFGVILAVTALPVLRLRAISGIVLGYLDYFFTFSIVLMVFNFFDLLIAGRLVFNTNRLNRILLAGTEGMAGYKDYAFHFRGFVIGIVFSAVGAAVFAGIAPALVPLLA